MLTELRTRLNRNYETHDWDFLAFSRSSSTLCCRKCGRSVWYAEGPLVLIAVVLASVTGLLLAGAVGSLVAGISTLLCLTLLPHFIDWRIKPCTAEYAYLPRDDE